MGHYSDSSEEDYNQIIQQSSNIARGQHNTIEDNSTITLQMKKQKQKE